MNEDRQRPVTRKEFYELGSATFTFMLLMFVAMSVDTEWFNVLLILLIAAVASMYGWLLIKEMKRSA
ncbi:hypothetical protein ACERK3_02160 [Phycisphaerales bacterium AB-hyl4]|uniref:Uncharacterized protein n=1 Tax=Natronomicrosphaera hydrolytica TaxID=3242702 RepID=A0ABV4U2M2_9BACT